MLGSILDKCDLVSALKEHPGKQTNRSPEYIVGAKMGYTQADVVAE